MKNFEEIYAKKRENFLKGIAKNLDKTGVDWSIRILAEFDGDVTDHYVFFSEWNYDKTKWIEDILSKYDSKYYARASFDDEYVFCSYCGKACYMYPSFYGAGLSFTRVPPENNYQGEEILCRECFNESYLEGYKNNPSYALPSWAVKYAEKEGFSPMEGEYQSGFHEGMNDDPEKIIKNLPKDHDYIFAVTETSQFYFFFTILRKIKGI